MVYLPRILGTKIRKEKERLLALRQVCKAANLPLDAFLQRVLNLALPLIGADFGAILLVNEEGFLTVRAGQGLCKEGKNLQVKLGQGIEGKVASQGEVIFSKISSGKSQLLTPYLKQPKVQITLPLKTRGKIIGVFNLVRLRAHRFRRKEIDFLLNLADQVALATEDAFLFEKVKHQLAKLSVLYKVAKAASSTLDLKKLLQFSLDSVLTLFPAQSGSIMLLDEKGKLTIKAARGLPEEIIQKTQLRRGEGIAGWVAQRGESLLLREPFRDSRFKRIETERGIRDALSVPLKVKKKIIGVFNISNKVKEPFGPDDLSLLSALASEIAMAIENARLYGELKENSVAMVKTLAKMVEVKDRYTSGHLERTTDYVLALAKDLGFPASEREELEIAARLHDVGKIGVSESILSKPGKLTEEEMEVVKKHPAMAVSILEPLHFSKQVIQWICYHHEQPDGQGYPQGISKIPLGASILRVVDAFEAMVSDRPYRKALSVEEALLELEKYARVQFDPFVVRSFLGIGAQKPG